MGRIKGEIMMGGWGEDRRGREGNERKGQDVPLPHPKLNPSCATGLHQNPMSFCLMQLNYSLCNVQV